MNQPDSPRQTASRDDQRRQTFLGVELTWRLSVDVHADLPKEARRYINKAARAGWLDGDAVSEISDHFRAALAHGRSVKEIVTGLGPAGAFGSQWGRTRSPARWVMAQGMTWTRRLIAACFVGYIALWACLRWAQPAPSVDYYALLNQPTLTTPADTHAWPFYRQALLDPRMHADAMYQVFAQPGSNGNEAPLDSLIRPGDAGWPRIVAYLNDIQPLLDLVRQGADKPNLGCLFMRTHNQPQDDRRALAQDPLEALEPTPVPADALACRLAAGHVNEFDLPHFSTIQTLTAPITADMLHAADRSDRKRVLEDFQTLLKVSRQLRQVPVFSARTYAVGIVNRAAQRIAVIAMSYPGLLSETDLADIRRTSSNEINQFTTLTPILDVQYLDRVQRSYTRDGGNGRITLDGALFLFGSLSGHDVRSITVAPTFQARFLAECYLPFLYLTLPREKELNRQRAQVLAGALLSDVSLLVTQEPWNVVTRPPKFFEKDTGPQDWFTEMLFFGSPADYSTFGHLKTVALWQSQTQAQIDDSLLAVAQYRAHFGRYPENFAQLIPDILPMPPAAMEPDQFLILKSTNDGPVIYSIGVNGTDEGGVFIPTAPGMPPQGDHLYFPEYNRRLAPPMTALKSTPAAAPVPGDQTKP
jgi:hypothetical protein